jgi:nucleotide sugar dehydrogenase
VRVVLVALGKIGLPLAAKIALAGHEVVGCDIDPSVVESVNAARAPFPGEAGLDEALASMVGSGRLRAGTDTRAAVAAGAELVVAVPPLSIDAGGAPDFGALELALGQIGAGLGERAANADGPAVISIETTLPVGTLRGRAADALEAASGLVAERDFFLVHSPERVYAGRILADLERYPKLIGGLSGRGERLAAERYRAFLSAEVRELGSAEAAELTKLAETTYRDLNIAFANELAIYADRLGLDVETVIEAANSQPYSHIHRPGIAVGGHCIPVYPRLFLAGDPRARLPALAREINEGMPRYALDRLAAALGGEGLAGRRVLILGVSYRGAVKETAFSGALALREELRARGATPLAADPLYAAGELRALGFEPWDGTPIEAAVLQADHPEYRELEPSQLPGVRAVLDGRRVVARERFERAGVSVLVIGAPSGG